MNDTDHPRYLQNRRAYWLTYIVVSATPPFALLDPRDGFLLAFTDYDEAANEALKFSGFVTSLSEFRRLQMLLLLNPPPPAIRICRREGDHRLRHFIAPISVPLRALQAPADCTPTDLVRHRLRSREMMARSCIVEETA